jgi:TonB family protein
MYPLRRIRFSDHRSTRARSRWQPFRLWQSTMRLIAAAVLLMTVSSSGSSLALGQTEGPWIVQRKGARFTADGEIMRVSGGNGWARTPPAFLNFTLRLQVRAVTEGARGAVLVRTLPGRPDDWPGAGIRVGLDARANHSFVTVSSYEGSLERVGAEAPAPPKPIGEWRDLSIQAEGQQLTIVVDGTQVQRLKVSDVWAGYMGIAAEAGTMEYRNISVTSPDEHIGCAADGDLPGSQALSSKTAGILPPRVTREVKPRYTWDALTRRAEGAVLLEAVVLEDGSVGPVCVRRRVDPDLDLQAVAAAKGWRFAPGTRDGVPVRVLVTIELSFTLGR